MFAPNILRIRIQLILTLTLVFHTRPYHLGNCSSMICRTLQLWTLHLIIFSHLSPEAANQTPSDLLCTYTGSGACKCPSDNQTRWTPRTNSGQVALKLPRHHSLPLRRRWLQVSPYVNQLSSAVWWRTQCDAVCRARFDNVR